MYCCEECQREFKTAQALAGHDQFKHGVRRAAGAALQQLGQQLVEDAPAAREQHAEQLGYILERLDELLAPAAQHAHESSCHECHQFAEEVHEQGRRDGINEIAEIAGVKDAVAFASSTERWNEKHPDHKIDENWASVPGVRDLIENSQPNLINITRSEESSPDNPVIRVVTTPEGDLQRREMIRAEVKRNVPAMAKAAAQRPEWEKELCVMACPRYGKATWACADPATRTVSWRCRCGWRCLWPVIRIRL